MLMLLQIRRHLELQSAEHADLLFDFSYYSLLPDGASYTSFTINEAEIILGQPA